MVKTLNVVFEDKEFEILDKFKAKYILSWHDIILKLIKADMIDLSKIKNNKIPWGKK